MDITAVNFDRTANELVLLDQTLLPNEVEYIRPRGQSDIWTAIHSLQVRGAPAIGIAAGYGAYLASLEINTENKEEFLEAFLRAKKYLASSRPTAVNLFWALDRMEARLRKELSGGTPLAGVPAALLAEAEEIQAEDIAMCRKIGENGLKLLKPGMGILTHCNAGQLAASRYGTALAPIYVGHEQGCNFRVFADETRPLLQGARLTTFELLSAGVNTTVICDNMVSSVMKKGWVDAVLVGCDRVAANGDAANKIGTSGVAILAKHYGIPFYVLGPTSTIDMNCPAGENIEIEERKPEEVTTMWYKKPMAPANVNVFNPAFDVTDNELITGIITQHGVAKAPFTPAFEEWLKYGIS